MPMATPEKNSSNMDFLMWRIGIFCLVIRRKPPISAAARMARYSASSPEETEIFRTNSASVPNTAIDTASRIRAILGRCIKIPPGGNSRLIYTFYCIFFRFCCQIFCANSNYFLWWLLFSDLKRTEKVHTLFINNKNRAEKKRFHRIL